MDWPDFLYCSNFLAIISLQPPLVGQNYTLIINSTEGLQYQHFELSHTTEAIIRCHLCKHDCFTSDMNMWHMYCQLVFSELYQNFVGAKIVSSTPGMKPLENEAGIPRTKSIQAWENIHVTQKGPGVGGEQLWRHDSSVFSHFHCYLCSSRYVSQYISVSHDLQKNQVFVTSSRNRTTLQTQLTSFVLWQRS